MNRRNPELLDEDDLRQWVDYDRRSDLERWLRENGIRFRHGKAGQVAEEAFTSAWQRLMAKAKAAGLRQTFTFHDLKAKGITDHTEHAGGHKSARMRETYVRRPDEVDSTR